MQKDINLVKEIEWIMVYWVISSIAYYVEIMDFYFIIVKEPIVSASLCSLRPDCLCVF